MIKTYFLVILEHRIKEWSLYILSQKQIENEDSATLGFPVGTLNSLEDQHMLGFIEKALNLIEEKRGEIISVTSDSDIEQIHRLTRKKAVKKYLVTVRAHSGNPD